MEQQLPEKPNLNHLRKQAKDLRRSGNHSTLADAQLQLAQNYGFPSWPKLVHHVEDLLARQQTRQELADRFRASRTHLRPVREAELTLAADPTIVRFDLETACIACDPEAVRELLTREAPTDRHIVELFFSPLAKRRIPQVVEIARMLLERGVNPSAALANQDPLSILYAAVSLPSYDAVKMLLEAGANPNDHESLYHSCENDGIEFTRLLLDNGAEIPGNNALNRMSDYERPEGIRLLCERGGDPNADHTLCHAVDRGRSVEFIRILVEFGGDPDLVNRHQISARRLAYHRGYPLDLFDGSFEPTPFDRALRACWLNEPIDMTGVDLNEAPNGAFLAIHHAVSEGDLTKVRNLIQLGLAKLGTGYSKETALHQAAWHGHSQIIRELVAAGADVSSRDNMYQGLPINWAQHGSIHCSHNRHPETIRTLIELGSPPPSHLMGSDEVVEAIVDLFPEMAD